jgi:hypothetical protein
MLAHVLRQAQHERELEMEKTQTPLITVLSRDAAQA